MAHNHPAPPLVRHREPRPRNPTTLPVAPRRTQSQLLLGVPPMSDDTESEEMSWSAYLQARAKYDEKRQRLAQRIPSDQTSLPTASTPPASSSSSSSSS